MHDHGHAPGLAHASAPAPVVPADRVEQAPGEVTRLLAVVAEGGADAESRLLEVVYLELQRIASSHLRGDPAHWIIRTTSMVHEAYMRLLGSAEVDWRSRGHFFGAAARAMRRIMVERIRQARTLKRGGGHTLEPFDDQAHLPASAAAPGGQSRGGRVVDVEALDGALTRLQALDARKAEVISLHYFTGLEMQMVALAMGISERTAYRDLDAAKAWLARELDLA